MTTLKTSLTVIHKIIGNAPFLFEGSFSDGAAYAKKLGYDCVELHATSPDELQDPAFLHALEEHQIQVSAIGTGRLYVNDGLSLTSPDPGIRQKTLQKLKEFIDIAGTLNSIIILGCVRGNVPAPESYASILALLSESMKELDLHAQKRAVTMVFEPINRYENNYLCSTYEIADFLHTNNLKNTKMMIDTFHMNIEERDIRRAIVDNITDISYVHLADSNRLVPGEGHLDFAMILETLISNGYNGVISAECLPLPSREAAAANWLSSVKELLSIYE